MTSLALNASLTVLAGAPFICGIFMAGGAQFSIGCDGHELIGVVGLKWSVARLAADTFLGIRTCLRIKACSVACQAVGLLPKFTPIALENRGRKCLRMARVFPGVYDTFMALFA